MEPRCFKLLATLAPAEKFNMQIYRTLSSFIHPPLYFSDEQPSSKFNTHISNNSSSSNNNVNININHSNQNEKRKNVQINLYNGEGEEIKFLNFFGSSTLLNPPPPSLPSPFNHPLPGEEGGGGVCMSIKVGRRREEGEPLHGRILIELNELHPLLAAPSQSQRNLSARVDDRVIIFR